MRRWEAASLRTAVEFTFWQRMEGEKVLMKVMNLTVPLLWLIFYSW